MKKIMFTIFMLFATNSFSQDRMLIHKQSLKEEISQEQHDKRNALLKKIKEHRQKIKEQEAAILEYKKQIVELEKESFKKQKKQIKQPPKTTEKQKEKTETLPSVVMVEDHNIITGTKLDAVQNEPIQEVKEPTEEPKKHHKHHKQKK